MLFLSHTISCGLHGNYGRASFANEKKEKELIINGTIVAVERIFGHIYSDTEINESYLVVRIDEILEGRQEGNYILVHYYWKLKDKVHPFNNDMIWKFKLLKESKYNNTLDELQFVTFKRETDKGYKLFLKPRFYRVKGMEIEQVPFNEQLQCYKLTRENVFPSEAVRIDEERKPLSDKEYFLISKERWINIENAPLQIGLSGGRGTFIIMNSSDKPIKEYTFGCVQQEPYLRIEYSFFPSSYTNMFLSINDSNYDFQNKLNICNKDDSKLAIIKVVFENGSIWQLDSK